MKLTLFRSTGIQGIYGFTANPTGDNLPNQFGPWQLEGSTIPSEIASSGPVSRAIERDGFYLARTGSAVLNVSESGTVH
jgi:hypothetical protein